MLRWNKRDFCGGLFETVFEMKALKQLENLLLEESRDKYPSIPEHARTVNLFGKLKPEKREKKRIEAFLNVSGHYAAIIENRGQRVDNRQTVTDVIGRQKVIGSVTFIGSGMRKGLSDLKATIFGRSVDIELKRIYKKGKDRQSDEQKEEQIRVERAGGIYLIVSDFEDFYIKYLELIAIIK